MAIHRLGLGNLLIYSIVTVTVNDSGDQQIQGCRAVELASNEWRLLLTREMRLRSQSVSEALVASDCSERSLLLDDIGRARTKLWALLEGKLHYFQELPWRLCALPCLIIQNIWCAQCPGPGAHCRLPLATAALLYCCAAACCCFHISRGFRFRFRCFLLEMIHDHDDNNNNTALHCTVLYCTYCTVLDCTVLYYCTPVTESNTGGLMTIWQCFSFKSESLTVLFEELQSCRTAELWLVVVGLGFGYITTNIPIIIMSQTWYLATGYSLQPTTDYSLHCSACFDWFEVLWPMQIPSSQHQLQWIAWRCLTSSSSSNPMADRGPPHMPSPDASWIQSGRDFLMDLVKSHCGHWLRKWPVELRSWTLFSGQLHRQQWPNLFIGCRDSSWCAVWVDRWKGFTVCLRGSWRGPQQPRFLIYPSRCDQHNWQSWCLHQQFLGSIHLVSAVWAIWFYT